MLNVVFKTHLGETFDNEFNANTQIATLRQHVADIFQVTRDFVILFYETFMLKDEWYLEEIGYHEGKEIFVKVRQEPAKPPSRINSLTTSDRANEFSTPPEQEIDPFSNSVEILMAMGFAKQQSRVALEMFNNDINQATEYLLTGPVDPTPKPAPPPSPRRPAPPPPAPAPQAGFDRAISTLLDEFPGVDPSILADIYSGCQDLTVARETVRVLGLA